MVKTDDDLYRSLINGVIPASISWFGIILHLCDMSPLGEGGGRIHVTLVTIFATFWETFVISK